jgi:hypothetical protein
LFHRGHFRFKAFKAFSRTILKFGFGEARLRGTSAVSWQKMVPESHRGFPKWEAPNHPSNCIHGRYPVMALSLRRVVALAVVALGAMMQPDPDMAVYHGVSQFLMAFLLVT